MRTEEYIQSLKTLPGIGRAGRRIIIAGGGTGGHIFPAIAIANAIRKQQPAVEILFVGAHGKMEMQKIPEAGYKIIGLHIAGYNRSSSLKNIMLPFKLVRSFLQVTDLLRKFKPDAIVGVGGYSSFPVLRLAQTRNISTFILESNSLAGKANMMLAKRATKIFVASYGMEKYFPPEKILMTGNPVRQVFSETKISKNEALEFFGFKPGMKTVFIMGGSLGAKSINQVIEKNINFFRQNNLQLIWQTGRHYASDAAKIEEERSNVWTNAFIDRMEYAYEAADLVVSRAGAMAIAELCIVGKPVIFVPYPFASEDHQTANAMALVNKNGALIIKDNEADEKLTKAILTLVKDEGLANELQQNISQMSNTKADAIIAAEVLKHIQ